jgi:hypothetical protein
MLLWWHLWSQLFKAKHRWLQRTRARHWDAYRRRFFDDFGIWPEEHALWVEKQHVSNTKARRFSAVSAG